MKYDQFNPERTSIGSWKDDITSRCPGSLFHIVSIETICMVSKFCNRTLSKKIARSFSILSYMLFLSSDKLSRLEGNGDHQF